MGHQLGVDAARMVEAADGTVVEVPEADLVRSWRGQLAPGRFEQQPRVDVPREQVGLAQGGLRFLGTAGIEQQAGTDRGADQAIAAGARAARP